MEYALVNKISRVVENVILWDGKAEYYPPNGVELVKVAPGTGIGWTFTENGDWFPPVQVIGELDEGSPSVIA